MRLCACLSLACSLSLLACGATPRTIDTASKARFTETALPMARELTPYPAKISGDLSISLEAGSGPEDVYEINLASPWDYCHKEPGDCDAGVKRFMVLAINRLEKSKDAKEAAAGATP